MNITKIKEYLSNTVLVCFVLLLTSQLFRDDLDGTKYEVIGYIIDYAFLFSLFCRIIVGSIETIKKRKWSNLLYEILAVVIVGLIMLALIPKMKSLNFRERTEYGAARLFHEYTQNGVPYNNIPDTLYKNSSINVLLLSFSIIEFQTDSGSALYFKPRRNSYYSKLSYYAHFGICVDYNGDIYSLIPKNVSTYEECRKREVTGTVDSVLSER